MRYVIFAMLALTLTVAAQVPGDFSPRSHLKPRSDGMLSVLPSGDAQTAYRLLAERSGINVVFHRGFDGTRTVSERLDNLNIFDALDRLSAATGNFWFVWDDKTIVVAPDSPATRLLLEPTVVKVIYLNPGTPEDAASTIVNELRSRARVRNIFRSRAANAIVMAERPEAVFRAEVLIADLTGVGPSLRSTVPIRLMGLGNTGNVLLGENSGARRFLPDREAGLHRKLSNPISLDRTGDVAAIYEELAGRAGLNVVVDRRLPRIETRFRVDSTSILDVFDLLALQTGTMWQFLNDSTIGVREDTAANRRDYEPMAVRLIHFSNTTTPQARNEIVNVLRTSLGMRNLFPHDPSNAILIRDTPLRIALAERVVGDLVTTGIRPPSAPMNPATSSTLVDTGWVLGSAQAARQRLDLQRTSLVNIRLNGEPRAAYEALAELAGLTISADSTYPELPAALFSVNGVDILDAFDLLAWQTSSFWQVVDGKTVRVSAGGAANRRALEPRNSTTVYSADTSQAGVNGMLNILRTVLQLRDARVDEKGGIVITDTADNLALAEEVVSVLNRAR